jgi:threonine synthase
MPVGAGSSLFGCASGFRELLKAGQIARLPRLFVCQPLNCSPIDASFHAGVDTPVAREVRKTIAEGTAIKHPMRLREIIGAVRESGGGTVALSEEEIVTALRRLARQGLFAEPTSASAAAALDKLSADGSIGAGETTVVILTGTGLKAATVVADLVQQQEQRS